MQPEAGHRHDDHAPVADPEDAAPGHYELLSRAMQELLIERGIVTANEIRAMMERFETEYPLRGARVVARAWVDPEFRQRLLADGKAACEELGFEQEAPQMIAVENTPEVHNVIVCTLCSCYPRQILGMPPTWYKSSNYRSRVVREPRAVLAEFGTLLPDHVAVRVHDSTADMRYLVVPMRPAGTEGMTEEELAALITRDCMVGVTTPAPPRD